MFGDNGVPLDRLNDRQLERELQSKTAQHTWLPAATFAAVSALFLVFGGTIVEVDPGLLQFCFVAQAVLVLFPAMIAHSERAVRDGKLPVRLGQEPKWEHVSGPATTLLLLLIVGVIWTARVFEDNYDHLVIDGQIGLLMLVAVASAFLLLIFSPRLIAVLESSAPTRVVVRLFGPNSLPAMWFEFVSRVLSTVDSWLVYIVAPVGGVTLKSDFNRYAVMATYLLSCGVLAWHLPAPWGLAPLFWAFLLAFSINRRWAWVEGDRALTLRKPDYSEDQLRVGVEQDLRDEALLGLLSFILLLPLGMRQLHFASSELPVFQLGSGASDDLTWMQFFGVELTKAVPFVDWADIYNVRTESVIRAETAMSSHVVFVTRAIVDLLFLASLLQAISVSMRLMSHKRMFFDRELNVLDPMIEKKEFGRLAYKKGDQWVFLEDIEKFKHYDTKALSRLRVANKGTVTYRVATEIMRLNGVDVSTQGERFLEAASSKSPNVSRVLGAMQSAVDANDLPLEFLVPAHRNLNGRKAFNQARIEIVRLIVNLPQSDERTTALRHILVGPDSDRTAQVREMAIAPLEIAARSDARVAKTLERASKDDRSGSIRWAAEKALSRVTPREPAPAL